MNTCTCTNSDWVVSILLASGFLFGVCHGHTGSDRTVPVPGGHSCWGLCHRGAHVVPRTLGALGSLRERHGQTLLVLQPAVHPDLVLFFTEYTGFGRFPPADPDVRGLGGGRGV